MSNYLIEEWMKDLSMCYNWTQTIKVKKRRTRACSNWKICKKSNKEEEEKVNETRLDRDASVCCPSFIALWLLSFRSFTIDGINTNNIDVDVCIHTNISLHLSNRYLRQAYFSSSSFSLSLSQALERTRNETKWKESEAVALTVRIGDFNCRRAWTSCLSVDGDFLKNVRTHRRSCFDIDTAGI